MPSQRSQPAELGTWALGTKHPASKQMIATTKRPGHGAPSRDDLIDQKHQHQQQHQYQHQQQKQHNWFKRRRTSTGTSPSPGRRAMGGARRLCSDSSVAATRAPLVKLSAPFEALFIMTTLFLVLGSITVSEAVDCFKCYSRNGSNPACEDPFHNLNTTRITTPILPDPPPWVIYHTPCYAGRKGREGLFPASACIKLTGTFDTTGETLVVRHCALDSGTLTQDTELARMSHCGKFQFEGDLLKGCVLVCPYDACNSAPPAVHRRPADAAGTLALLAAGALLVPTLHALLPGAPLAGRAPPRLPQ